MPIRARSGGPAAPVLAAAPPPPPVQPVAAAPAPAAGIVSPRQRAVAAAATPQTDAIKATPAAPPPSDDMDSWGHSGAEAEAIANRQVQERETAREERRARGYWPRKFELIPPGTQSRNGPINDRFQADIIVLDIKPSNSFWLHVLKNPRTGRYDQNEPCPKEWDSCPVCPPAGQYDSRFVFLLSVLNITGYTRQTGPNAGEFVPITHEIMVVETGDMPFFYNLMRERGDKGLRGLQLTMTRTDKNSSRIGAPSNPNGSETAVFHDDAQIEAFIRQNGMWKEKKTQEGEVIAGEDWLMHPHDYKTFVHRPSGADLRARFGATGGGNAPVGSNAGTDGGQWGGSRYEPGATAPPAGGGQSWGDTVGNAADLDDQVPF